MTKEDLAHSLGSREINIIQWREEAMREAQAEINAGVRVEFNEGYISALEDMGHAIIVDDGNPWEPRITE